MRKLTKNDRETFLRLSEAFYASPAVLHPVPRAHHERAFEELMRSDEYAECCLLERDGRAAGVVLLAKTYSREAGGRVLWIEEVFVLPDYRSCGLGGECFREIEAYARENGFARIRLEAESDNGRALSLYERLGYVPLEYVQRVKEL